MKDLTTFELQVIYHAVHTAECDGQWQDIRYEITTTLLLKQIQEELAGRGEELKDPYVEPDFKLR